MKKLIIIFFLIVSCISFSQTNIDSLKNELAKAKKDTSHVLLLATISRYYENTKVDTAILLAAEGYELAKEIYFDKGQGICLNIMGTLFMKKDNYFLGLQTELNALKIFEKLNDQKKLSETYYAIGNLYERIGSYRDALNNFLRSEQDVMPLKDSVMLMNCLSSLGYNYYNLEQLDSALKYAQQSYDLAITIKNTERLPWTIALLGAVEDKMNNPAIAMAYYYDALGKANLNNQQDLFPYLYQVMAALYKHTTLMDSAITYGEKALKISQDINFTKGIVDASIFLADIYSGFDNNKAVAYYKLSLKLKDSVFSEDNIKQIQNISYTEEMRQHELEKQKLEVAETRKRNIEYTAIIIGLISFVILFLLLSHSIVVNAKLISFFGVIGLLVVFEFINLLLHPFLSRVTNDSPVFMLLALVCIAAMLVPAHHSLQKWITQKLVAKNNRIRLSAAKKTIAHLEKNNSAE